MTALDAEDVSFVAQFQDGTYKQRTAAVLIGVESARISSNQLESARISSNQLESARIRDVEVIHTRVLRSALPSAVQQDESPYDRDASELQLDHSLRTRRNELLTELLQAEEKLEAALQEIAAVDRELLFPDQTLKRAEALRRNREAQQKAAAQLKEQQSRIQSEIDSINESLDGIT